MQRTLLVTGFGPFPTMPRNPSAALARQVAASPRWRLHDVAARSLILTTAYAAITAELDPALKKRPDAVLMIGVAGRSRRVRVETRGTSRRSTLFPDVAGIRARTPALKEPEDVRRSAFAGRKALLALVRHGVPARLSRDAGRYLCNASYHHALGLAPGALFIHVPKTPSGGSAEALVEIALLLLRDARRTA